MSTRFQIAAILFLIVQSVAFGATLLVALQTAPAEKTMALLPWIVVFSAFVSGPIAWTIAPRMRARFKRQRRIDAVWRG